MTKELVIENGLPEIVVDYFMQHGTAPDVLPVGVAAKTEELKALTDHYHGCGRGLLAFEDGLPTKLYYLEDLEEAADTHELRELLDRNKPVNLFAVGGGEYLEVGNTVFLAGMFSCWEFCYFEGLPDQEEED